MKTYKVIMCIFMLFGSRLWALPFTHYTNDDVAIRKEPNINSAVIILLEKNIGVDIIETGMKDMMNGSEGVWLKILAANGYKGWCFSSYLNLIEENVAEDVALQIKNRIAGDYPKSIGYRFKKMTKNNLFNSIKNNQGYYIQQNMRRFQGPGKAPEILKLFIENNNVYIQETDIKNGKLIESNKIKFSLYNGFYKHNKSYIKSYNGKIVIFYLEHIPEKKWLGTWEYENGYTFVSNLNDPLHKKVVSLTSDYLKNYAGKYAFDSFKLIFAENYNLDEKLIEIKKSVLNIKFNSDKKCLSVPSRKICAINTPDTRGGDFSFDFVETSMSEPFYWIYGDGFGFKEERFWFYKGGIAVSCEADIITYVGEPRTKKTYRYKYTIFYKKVDGK